MTIGEKIKKMRIEQNLTQKELASKLNVTFQTVSKWENDINVPDIYTLKNIAKVLNINIEYLIDEDENLKKENEEIAVVEEPKKVICKCSKCGKDILEDDKAYYGVLKTGHVRHRHYTDVCYCQSCYLKEMEVENSNFTPNPDNKPKNKEVVVTKNVSTRMSKFSGREDKKAIIVSIIVCIVLYVAFLSYYICNYEKFGLSQTIFMPLLIAYIGLSTTYCVGCLSFISSVFFFFWKPTIHWPGIIFTFDLDGFKFLIFMKLLFAVLGFTIALISGIFGFALSAFLSFFAYIPLLIKNRF